MLSRKGLIGNLTTEVDGVSQRSITTSYMVALRMNHVICDIMIPDWRCCDAPRE